MPSYLAKVALLAALYFLAGKLGLSLAVPPAYATVIWPPTGIALGMLLAHGRGLAPGVFLGSFLLNATVGHTPHDLPTLRDLLLSTCIATGSTLQVVLAHALIVRWFGLPIRLRRITDILRLLAVAGPITCLLSATIGVASLYAFGGLPREEMANNWFTWWSGDIFGVLVFLPLALVLLGGRAALIWRDRAVRGLQAISLTLLLLPLGLTFYAWKSLAETSYRHSQTQFQTLAAESEQAMNARLAVYSNATRSGAGVLQSSNFVSREEWHTFIEALRLREDYPGMLGLGWMEHQASATGAARDVVAYLEPDNLKGVAIGLDIDVVPRIREAADRAAWSGLPAITRPIALGHDDDLAPGFILLQPVYRTDVPTDTAELRKRALRGFVFTPFQARGLFADLTPSQGRRMDVSLSAAGAQATEMVFSTRLARSPPRFSVTRVVQVFGTPLTLRWDSAAEFERTERAGGAHLVLFGGLLFTGLFGVLLVVFGARRQAVDAAGPLEQPWLLPVATFVLVASCSLAAFALLSNAEDAHVSSQVESETRRLEAGLDRLVRERLQVVRRMAHRWSAGGGTPYVVWRNDALDLVRQVEGLEELQWIGSDYHIHWAEGSRRRGWVDRLDVRANAKFARDLAESAERGLTFVTEPYEFERGESAFIVHVPVTREGRFDGFLAATFSGRELFGEVFDSAGGPFAYAVQYDGVTYFDDEQAAAANPAWTREGGFKVNDRRWTFTVSATQDFVDGQHTLLPLIVLIAGVLIASLASVLVRYVLVVRFKAAHLKASAEALSASEQRYELALRGMSVGLWDWNIEGNSMFLSQRCKDILGIAPDFSPSFNGFLSRLHADDKPNVEKALFGHFKQKNSFDVEFRIRREDGEYVWVHIYGQAQYNDGGFAARMAGSMQDITQKKQQEQELMRSGAQLRLLVENTPAAVAMFDTEMRYILTSRRWLQDYGFEDREIVGVSHYDLFPEIRSMPHWIDIHRRAMRGEQFDIREDSWLRADGQKEWNQWAIHPWMDADGKIGGIVMFTEVITARKQAEAALRSSEAMNRAAMDKAPIGKALVHPDGHFIKVNPALCQLVGYSEDELLATNFQAITHPDDLAGNLDHVHSLLDAKIASYQTEKRYIHRDGRIIWAQVSVSLVRRVDNSPEFLVAQIQDVTERRTIDAMKEEFVAVVSQELRAPLVAIRDSLGEISAMRDARLPESVQHLFEVCNRNGERLGGLVEEILDLEKLAAGQMRFDFKDERIALITRQAVSVNEAYSRITLKEIDPSLTVYLDSSRYGQVLSNLLSNAAKFSAPDSVIEVGAEERGDWIRVYVRDQGEGIPEEFRARIFSKFAIAQPTGAAQKSGAGLGLYITRQLVEQMRGRIGFVSQVGEGATFWLEFPRVSRGERRLSA